jgi:tetratricopeptide (TPR) repeat protein
MTTLYGHKHQELLSFLVDGWWRQEPAVCWVEGFPGVGKTELHRHLAHRLRERQIPTAYVNLLEEGADQLDTLFLKLAQAFAEQGEPLLARKIDAGNPQAIVQTALLGLLANGPRLLVLDEFQCTLNEHGEPAGPFSVFLKALKNKTGLQSRVLLLTDRRPHPGVWSENLLSKTLGNLDAPDGAAYLLDLLREQGREAAIPAGRLDDVVAWVGGNPRALRAVVAALAYEPLQSLVELQPESWELRERQVSPDLLHELETQLVGKVLKRLEDADREVLFGVSVFRRPFPSEGFERFLKQHKNHAAIRTRLVDNLLVKQLGQSYALEKVAREVAARFAAEKPERYRGAHSLAGSHYARHFSGKQIVGGAWLGGDFVEAKFHWVQAQKPEELKQIARQFMAHVQADINWVTPVPAPTSELDERIALLTVLLDDKGPPSLHYHLARCLERRGQPTDAGRALQHAKRALARQVPPDAWLLAMRLAERVEGTNAAITLGKRGVSQLPVTEIYQSCAELLARDGKPQDAVDLLRDGIAKIPADKSLSSLYQICAELLARDGKTQDAVDLLRDGIAKIPADKNVFALYQACAELLARDGKTQDAVDLLRDGIAKIPADKSLFSLYQACAELLARDGKTEDAVDLLRDGIAKIPADKSLASLYQICAELLARDGKTQNAVDLLRDGIAKIPADKSLSPLYQSCAELLARDGKTQGAVDLLRDGIAKIPAKFGGYKLSESLLSLAVKAQRQDWLEDFLARRLADPDSALQCLAEVLLRQMQGDWPAAARLAAQGRERQPHYMALCAQEAFSWLCAGQAREACAALARYPRPLEYPVGHGTTWLACFISLRNGDTESAARFYALYRGVGAAEHPIPEPRDLLSLWNSPVPFSSPHPSHVFPCLPPSLTGLDHPVTRPPTCEPVPLHAPAFAHREGLDRALSADTGQTPASPLETPATLKIFISYAHAQRKYFSIFKADFEQYARFPNLAVEIFSDEGIPLGTDWDRHLQGKSADCDVMLLLVSQEFMNSQYIREQEFGPAIQRLSAGKNMLIAPIYFAPCFFESDQELARLQFFKPNGDEFEQTQKDSQFSYIDLVKFSESDGTLILNANRLHYMKAFVQKLEPEIQKLVGKTAR